MPDPTLRTYDASLAAHFAQLLSQREDELRALLTTLAHARPVADGHDVADFKDIADEQVVANLDRANAQRLELELQHISQAQRRLAEHRYGICQDCNEAMDLRRLKALPAAAYCAACQTRHEQQAAGHPLRHSTTKE